MSQYRVVVNGAKGKMGVMACETLKAHDDFNLVASLGRGDDLQQAIVDTKADVVVDLTSAEAAWDNTTAIIDAGARPVIGTSGLQAADIAKLDALCRDKNLGGIVVPNFSLGAVLMMHFASQAAALMPDVEIIEAHHQFKKDAPSGSAIKTAELIDAARTSKPQTVSCVESMAGALGATCQNVPIHSMRLPGFIASQKVVFGNTGETLEINHNSIDRSCFMPGIVKACRGVMGLTGMHYGLETLLLS